MRQEAQGFVEVTPETFFPTLRYRSCYKPTLRNPTLDLGPEPSFLADIRNWLASWVPSFLADIRNTGWLAGFPVS